MLRYVIIIYFASLIVASASTPLPRWRATTPAPSQDTSNDEDTEDDEIENIDEPANNIPLDRSYLGAAARQAYLGKPHLEPNELFNALPEMMNILSGHTSGRQNKTRSQARVDQAKRLIEMVTNRQVNEEVACDQPTMGTCDKDDDYAPEKGRKQKPFELKTKIKIIELKDKKKLKDRTIQRIYPRYRPQYLAQFRKDVAARGSRFNLRSALDQGVLDMYRRTRDRHLPVSGYMLIDWAGEQARRLGLRDFDANRGWLYRFMRDNRITSRKITKTISRPEANQQESIQENINTFLSDYYENSAYLSPDLIWNWDQTGFQYEPTPDRCLSDKGERDTVIGCDSKTKTKSSYTSQPVITRSGRMLGRLLVCLKDGEQFGQRVAKSVKKIEEEFKNIQVITSSSGKLTTNLMEQWSQTNLEHMIETQLARDPDLVSASDSEESYTSASNLERNDRLPQSDVGIDSADRECYAEAMTEDSRMYCGVDARTTRSRTREGFPLNTSIPSTLRGHRRAVDRESPCFGAAMTRADRACFKKPKVMLISDSWTGQQPNNPGSFLARLRRQGMKFLRIPPHATPHIQPLDVGFFRQNKIFMNRLQTRAAFEGLRDELTDRRGVLNLQSLMRDQFESPLYRDLIRHSWHNTDPNYSTEELTRYPPPGVAEIQFGFDKSSQCQHAGCNHTAWIRCAHCGRLLCFHHFWERNCFHWGETNDDERPFEPPVPPMFSVESDDIDLEDDLIYPPDELAPGTTPRPGGGAGSPCTCN